MSEERGAVFIDKVSIKNFRSIAGCEVSLGQLVFLVGANGAGKSNFLDALRLIADSLNTSLDHALRERGGVQEVRRRSSGHPTHFGIRIAFTLASGHAGSFAFEVSAKPRGDFAVKRETCHLGAAHYDVQEGQVRSCSAIVAPPASPDRLYLVNAAGLPEFRPVFDALSHMGFYNINPAQIRALQAPDKGDLLARDGRNLASVTARLERMETDTLRRRIGDYLSRVVPGVAGFSHVSVGHMETLEFRQIVEGSTDPWRFPAINMSDGTLRVAAILVALFQSGATEAVKLVGLEEPETALHPAAAGVLRDCLFEASSKVQVLVTSHSGDLLDDSRVPADYIRSVESQNGNTLIAEIDEASRGALRDKLYTAGELLRPLASQPDRSGLLAGSEGNLPLDAINKAAAREKSIRHGHPSTLHLWWARRPLAAARAVIFAQMVDDPSSYPDLFPTPKKQEKERQRLFKIIEELVQWENTTNEEVLERVREEIWVSWRRACTEYADHPRAKELFDRKKLPAFHDPFAGGGSLPLEAQRLGLEAHASDLNPVAVLINKAMIEIPPKFAGRPPVNPESRANKELFGREWKGAQGLAEDVRYYGKWMRDEAEKRIGHLYPKIEITEEMAKDECLAEQEGEFDGDTRFAVTWFETHGMEPGPFGTAETLATARSVSVQGVVEAGVLEAKGGKVRLLKRAELPDAWDPAEDKRLTVWEATQHLIKRLETQGEAGAAELLRKLGARAEPARDLCYRLYTLCERKKWAEEAGHYNGLIVAWPEISKLASQSTRDLEQKELFS